MSDKSYVSALDNPFITLTDALLFLDFRKDEKNLKKLFKNIEKRMIENNYQSPLNESIEERMTQILYLTDNMPDDFFYSCNTIYSAFFKMALPHHRLGYEMHEHDPIQKEERTLCIEFINNAFKQTIKALFDKKSEMHPDSEDTRLIVSTFAKTIAWTYTPCGSFFTGKGLMEHLKLNSK